MAPLKPLTTGESATLGLLRRHGRVDRPSCTIDKVLHTQTFFGISVQVRPDTNQMIRIYASGRRTGPYIGPWMLSETIAWHRIRIPAYAWLRNGRREDIAAFFATQRSLALAKQKQGRWRFCKHCLARHISLPFPHLPRSLLKTEGGAHVADCVESGARSAFASSGLGLLLPIRLCTRDEGVRPNHVEACEEVWA